jgi:uncharacterized repeat protein (TIGR03803 family)
MWLTELRVRWLRKQDSRPPHPKPPFARPRVRQLESRLTPSILTLATFDGADGTAPQGSVALDSAGNLYGTTYYQGSRPRAGAGALFEVAHGSGQITDIALFGHGTGLHPVGGLVSDSSGNLYGTAAGGGPQNDGTVFELANSSHTFSVLASFNGTNGEEPFGALLVDSSGNLFGTTVYGGASNDGTVFEVARGSGTITVLASFNGADGANPQDGLVMDSSGNLYGTTYAGGTSGDGTVFELAQGRGTVTTLASFDGTDGVGPRTPLAMDGSGNLYGVASGGGAQAPTIFELAQGGGTITTLATFSFLDGATTPTNVLLDGLGNLYGAMAVGGAYSAGMVFELPKGSGSILTLDSFNGQDGKFPSCLTEDANGNLYAVATGGPPSNAGSVFELPGGAIPADQWTGANFAVDTNWSDGANWSLGAAPTAGQRALFTNAPNVKSFTATVDPGFTNSIAGLEIDQTWNGTITVNSPLTVTGDFSLASGRFGGKGPVTVEGDLSQWTGGRIVVGAGGFTNTGSLYADTTTRNLVLTGSGTLTNDGTINVAGSNGIMLENGATLINAAKATLDFTGDGGLSQLGGGSLTNAGTLEKTGGAGTSTVSSSLVNSGAITVQTGTLALASAGGTNTGGSFSVSAGATLDLTGGTSVAYAGTYTGVGSGVVLLGSGTLAVGAGGATFGMAGPLFQWTSGTIDVTSGNFTNTGTINATGGTMVLTGAGSLTNDGTINESGGAVLLENSATLNNASGATFDLTADGGVSQSGGGTFTNSGTLEKTGGTGTSTIATTLDNPGTVTVTSGTLDISAAVTQVLHSTLKAGHWRVTGTPTVSATLDITSAGSLTILGAGATVTLTGRQASFTNLIGLTTIKAGGNLSLLGGQSFATPGALTNNGDVTVGARSILTVAGSFTQSSTAGLTIELGGTNAAPTFGQVLSTSGTVSLAGSLTVTSTVVPAVGSSFTILENEGNSPISGTFAGLSEGSTFTVTDGGTTMTFQITYLGSGPFGDNNVVITRTA